MHTAIDSDCLPIRPADWGQFDSAPFHNRCWCARLSLAPPARGRGPPNFPQACTTPRGWYGSLVGVRVDPPHFGGSGRPIVDMKSAAVSTYGRPKGGGADVASEFVRLSTLTSARRDWGGVGSGGIRWDRAGWDRRPGAVCEAAPKRGVKSFGSPFICPRSLHVA